MRRIWLIVGGVVGAALLAANYFFNPWAIEQRIAWSCGQPSLNCSQRMLSLGHIWSDYLSDRERARHWYARAADAGYAPAMFHLGWLYVLDAQDELFHLQARVVARRRAGEVVDDEVKTEIVRAPYRQAAEWFRRAAEQDFSPAMVMLGELYRNGKLDPADLDEAFRWYLAAARAGNPIGILNVYAAYRDGAGVTKDIVEAGKWSVWTPENDGPDVELTTLKRTTFRGARVSDFALHAFREAVETGEPVNVLRILFGPPTKDRLFRYPPVNTSLHAEQK